MQPTTASRKARSCETTTTVPAKPRSHSSSQRSPSPSRWLVGSSRSSTVGAASSVPASSARACSPPDSRASGVSGVEVVDAQRAARLVERRLQRPAAERLEALLRVAVALQGGGRRVAVGQPRQQRVQLAAHGPQLAQPGAEQLAEGRVRVRRLLGQPADALAGAGRRPRRGRGDRRRASSRSSVDLPTPLGPTRPARSPSPSTNERPSKSGAPSCAFVRSDACNMESSCVVREAGGLGARQARRAQAPACEDAGPPSRATARSSPRGRASPAGDRVRWLLTSPRSSVAPAARVREVRLPPQRSPRPGSRRRRRGRSSARRGPRPPGAPPGARAAARRRRRPPARRAGRGRARRSARGSPSVVAGSGVRSSAPSSAVPPSTTSLLARDDVDELLRVGLVEQPLAHAGRRHADDLPAHRGQRRVAGQLARAEAGAVDDGVGLELVERGHVAALERCRRARAAG